VKKGLCVLQFKKSEGRIVGYFDILRKIYEKNLDINHG